MACTPSRCRTIILGIVVACIVAASTATDTELEGLVRRTAAAAAAAEGSSGSDSSNASHSPASGGAQESSSSESSNASHISASGDATGSSSIDSSNADHSVDAQGSSSSDSSTASHSSAIRGAQASSSSDSSNASHSSASGDATGSSSIDSSSADHSVDAQGSSSSDSSTASHSSASGDTQGSSGAGHSSASGDAHGDHKSVAFEPMIFLLFAFALSMSSQQLVSLLPDCIQPPHSVVLYLFGMLSAYIATQCPDSEFGVTLISVGHIDPHIIFWVFLPMLLYEDSAGSDWHVTRRVLPSALLLALPGVILNTVLTGGFINLVMGMDFASALLLGTILSATDPVAVVGALHALQAPAKLSSIIAGEALLNDGSAVVLFQIFIEVASGRSPFDFGEAFSMLLRLALGGPALGLAVSLIVHVWLAKSKNFSVEMMIIFISVFALFFVAEHSSIHVSGVLAVVTFGLFISAVGKYNLATEKEHEHHAIVGFLALLSNEAIFIIAGIVGFNFSFGNVHIGARDWLDLAFLYVGVHVTRGAVVALSYPVLHRIGYRLSAPEAAICVYGGLRGAVGLAMALLVLGDSDMDAVTRDKIAFHTNGIVLGTLLINGVTIVPIYKALKIQSPQRQEHQRTIMRSLLQTADQRVEQRMAVLCTHWFFEKTHLDIVFDLVPSMSSCWDNHSEDFMGRIRTLFLKTDDVSQAVDNLLPRIKGQEKGSIVEEKLAASNRQGFHQVNMFVPSALREEELTAEDGATYELRKESTKANLEPTGVNIDVEVMNDDQVPPERLDDVNLQLTEEKGKINRNDTNESASKETSIDHVQTQISSASRARRSRATLRILGREDASGLLIEIFQSVTLTKLRAYKRMYESGSLTQAAFDLLKCSIDYEVEALQGDLKNYGFLEGELLGLHTKSAQEQMSKAAAVAFAYISHNLDTAADPLINSVIGCAAKRSRVLQWRLVERNTKALLAYSACSAQSISDLHEYKRGTRMSKEVAGVVDFALSEMSKLAKQAVHVELRDQLEQHPTMTTIYEHILLARLKIVQQVDVLKEMAEDGTISEHDLEHLMEDMMDRTLKGLQYFVPTRAQLEAGGSTTQYNHTFDRIIGPLTKLSLEPVN
eukprot:TRINITY_DN5227_c0_g3_i1.p1 TRINITY_DN5227_c0_g3~~TRINITY_DN5227_c0_g3_i1.p1  ORF type:complete len:1113 (+),score=219.34 TRINITY_DN5227_c0_g3_i1:32-3370(+)